MSLPPDQQGELQDLYSSLRQNTDYLKQNPEVHDLLASLVKDGTLKDLSGGSAPSAPSPSAPKPSSSSFVQQPLPFGIAAPGKPSLPPTQALLNHAQQSAPTSPAVPQAGSFLNLLGQAAGLVKGGAVQRGVSDVASGVGNFARESSLPARAVLRSAVARANPSLADKVFGNTTNEILQEPKSSPMAAFGRAGAKGVVPGAAALTVGELGAGIGTALGGGPETPTGIIGGVIGGLGGGIAGGLGGSKALDALKNLMTTPEDRRRIEQLEAQDVRQQPVASTVGNLAAQAAFMRPGAGLNLPGRAIGAGLGAALAAPDAIRVLRDPKATPQERQAALVSLGGQAAIGGLFSEANPLGHAIAAPGRSIAEDLGQVLAAKGRAPDLSGVSLPEDLMNPKGQAAGTSRVAPSAPSPAEATPAIAPPAEQALHPALQNLVDTFDAAGAFHSPEEKQAATALWQQRAKVWAGETGRPEDEFYHGIQAHLDAEPGANALKQDTTTPAFKQWFGESKVVDEKGEPLVVYHGTKSPEDFSVFEPGNKGYAYFTESPEYASAYAGGSGGSEGNAPNGGERVYPVYLSIKKPLDMTSLGDGRITGQAFIDFLKAHGVDAGDLVMRGIDEPAWERVQKNGFKRRLQKAGYDGIKQIENGDKVVYAAFDYEQAKSATGNNGEYNPNNPNIFHQRAGAGENTGIPGSALPQESQSGKIEDQASPAPIQQQSHFAGRESVAGLVGDKTTPVGFSIADIAKVGKVSLPSGASFDAYGGPYYHLEGFDPNAGSGNAWASDKPEIANAHHARAAKGAPLHLTLSNTDENVLASHGVFAIRAEIQHALDNGTVSEPVLLKHLQKTAELFNATKEAAKKNGEKKFDIPTSVPEFVDQLGKLTSFASRSEMANLFWKSRGKVMENPFGYSAKDVADRIIEPNVPARGASNVVNAFSVEPGGVSAEDSLHPTYRHSIKGKNLGITTQHDILNIAPDSVIQAARDAIREQGIEEPSRAKLTSTVKGFLLMGSPARGIPTGGLFEVPTERLLSFFKQSDPQGSVKAWYDLNTRTFGAITKASDFSSFVHETWHDWTQRLAENHVQTLEKHFGARDSVDYQEKGARAFERYLRDGAAPTPEVKPIFQTIKDAMTRIYQKIKGTAIEGDVHPEVRAAFDEILGGKKQGRTAEGQDRLEQAASLDVSKPTPRTQEMARTPAGPAESRANGASVAQDGTRPWQMTQEEYRRSIPDMHGFDMPPFRFMDWKNSNDHPVLPEDGVASFYHGTNMPPSVILNEGLKSGTTNNVFSLQNPTPNGGGRYTYEFEANVDNGDVVPANRDMSSGRTAYENPRLNHSTQGNEYYATWLSKSVPPESIKRVRDNYTGEIIYDRDKGGMQAAYSHLHPTQLRDNGDVVHEDYTAKVHRAAVGQAVTEGKPVPKDVLADYPDLKASKQPAAEIPAQATESPVQASKPAEAPATPSARAEAKAETPAETAKKAPALTMASIEADAKEAGITLPERDSFRRTFKETTEGAEKDFDSIASRLEGADPKQYRNATPEERYVAAKISAAAREKSAGIARQMDTATGDDLARLQVDFSRLDDQAGRMWQIAYRGGSDAGRALNFSKALVDGPWDINQILTRSEKMAGGELDAATRAKVIEIADRGAKVQSRQARTAEQKAAAALDRIRKSGTSLSKLSVKDISGCS